MSVFLLEEEKLLDTSIYIVPLVIPRVVWVMLRDVMDRYMQFALRKNTHFVRISPSICQIASSRVRPNSNIQISKCLHFTAIRSNICEGVKDMGQLFSWKILRIVISAINSPFLVNAISYDVHKRHQPTSSQNRQPS